MNKQNRPRIFYGTGKYARDNFHKWLNKGLVPSCFSDMDINKHFKFFPEMTEKGEEGFEILPLGEAISRYPDYELYVSMNFSNVKAAIDFLLEKGIPRERILTVEPLEFRKGCRLMGENIEMGPEYMSFCCYENKPIYKSTGNFDRDLAAIIEGSKKLGSDLLNGKKTTCDGCIELKEGYWPENWKSIGLALMGAFRMIYVIFDAATVAQIIMMSRKPPEFRASMMPSIT